MQNEIGRGARRIAASRRRPVKTVFRAALLLLLTLARFETVPAVAARSGVLDATLANNLARSTPDHQWNVIITLREQAALSQLDRATVPDVLRRHAARTQADLVGYLSAQPADQVRAVTALWIENALVVSASSRVLRAVAQRPDVARIQLDDVIMPPALMADNAPANLAAINAPAAWQRGITGQGVVVAVLDSGVDLQNADLASKWRGGSNSWFDPYGEHDTPADLTGHGTQVLGVILGGANNGVPIGVAPDARWIAAKIFNDRGRATTSGIHRALQWVLDPDGDPATADAPHVVNNSWSAANAGCDSEFAADLRALRAAGILPIFAAGFNGPLGPANLPEALAVGALAPDGVTVMDSARGPSACLPDHAVYPQLVAPGVQIQTTDRYGLFTVGAGTSLAAAHVSGALALVLSFRPHLGADEQAALLLSTAVDLGAVGPDNAFGYGRLDVAALIDRVAPTSPPVELVVIALVIGLGLVILRRSGVGRGAR